MGNPDPEGNNPDQDFILTNQLSLDFYFEPELPTSARPTLGVDSWDVRNPRRAHAGTEHAGGASARPW